MSVIHEENLIPVDGRALLFPLGILAAMAILGARMWFLQVVDGPRLSKEALRNRTTVIESMAPRGQILDRNGVLLAGVRPQLVVMAEPRTALNNPEVLKQVAAMLGKPAEEIEEQLKADSWRPFVPTPIADNITIEVATKIAELGQRLAGYSVRQVPIRYYPDTRTYSHLLGYVRPPSDRDVERLKAKKIKPADFVGKSGVERMNEAELMGQPGREKLEVDYLRRPVRQAGSGNATPGDKLILTIDTYVQKAAIEAMGTRHGAVVAIDPRNGEVICLVSKPLFDISPFLKGISQKEYAKLRDDPSHPQRNRAVGDQFPPGSTFKIVTSVAAELKGVFDPRRPAYCNHYYELKNQRWACLGFHSSVTFHTAMTKSCNAYFADLGRRAGPDALREACAEFGLGKDTGIDLEGEASGIVPTMEFVKRWRKPAIWYGGDTVNFSIGQGDMAATPIQMAHVAAIVANRGIGYRPHLVRGRLPVKDGAKMIPTKPEITNRVKVKPEFWNTLIPALRSVVTSGTARAANIATIPVAGKTGSAESRKGSQTHGWFVAFAPVDNPKIAICVLAERSGHGGEVAAPVARRVIDAYLNPKRPKEPTRALLEVTAQPKPELTPVPTQNPPSRQTPQAPRRP